MAPSTRTEIAAWLQVTIGMAALYFTIKSGGPSLEALTQVGVGGALPRDFMGAQGMIRVFLFLLALTTTLALVLVGLGVLLGAVFRRMGAALPNHASLTLIVAIVLLCLTVCFGAFSVPIWPGLGLLTLVALGCSGIAGVDETGEGYWVALVTGGGAAVFFGLMIAMAMTSTPVSQRSDVVPGHSSQIGEQTTSKVK